ncbi:MAG: hypothetical protein LJE67_15395, partial [Salaquimonas sp.]|nr:hypothetical protein [Salaquimonas sp.]
GEVEAVGSKPILQIRDDKVAALSSEQMAPSSGVIVRSVNGWINARPGSGGPTLITIVNVFAPCLNYEFKLVDKGPFGFTGLTLLIELVATLPDACQRGIFEGPIRFEKALESSSDFDSVAVEFEGELYFDPLEVAV